MGIQIFGLLIALTVWAFKLVNRGKTLTETKNYEKTTTETYSDSQVDDNLLKLSKAYMTAGLSYDREQTKEAEKLLKDHLEVEHKLLLGGQRDENVCRKLMMLKIRRTLVKHPYDQIGRKMAIQTKNLFVKQVLMPSHGTKPWEKLGKCFKIPTGVLKYPKLVIMLPMLWATFGTLRKGSVYIYDMH